MNINQVILCLFCNISIGLYDMGQGPILQVMAVMLWMENLKPLNMLKFKSIFA